MTTAAEPSLTIPGATPAPSEGAARPTIAVRGIWKIFGPMEGKQKAPPTDESSADYRRRTGSTIAVRDVKFDVQPGEQTYDIEVPPPVSNP